MLIKEVVDLIPLITGLTAVLTVALCAAAVGAHVLSLATRRARHERKEG